MPLQSLDVFKFVCIPLLNLTVFPSSEEEVRLGYELEVHHTVVMCKERLVAVPKVQAPDLHVPVGRAGCYQCSIVRDIHAYNRQFVSIQ